MAEGTSDLASGAAKKMLDIVQLDLRGTPCPLNFVRAKLRLEQMKSGALLEVWLDAGEPVEQVPDSLQMSGYSVEEIAPREGFFVLRVRKPDSGC